MPSFRWEISAAGFTEGEGIPFLKTCTSVGFSLSFGVFREERRRWLSGQNPDEVKDFHGKKPPPLGGGVSTGHYRAFDHVCEARLRPIGRLETASILIHLPIGVSPQSPVTLSNRLSP